MSQFSDEERQRILAQVDATLQRGQAEREGGSDQGDNANSIFERDAALEDQQDALAEAMRQPIESTNMRHRREIEQQEASFARDRRRREKQHVLVSRIDQAVDDLRREMRAEIDQLRGELQSIATASGTLAGNIADAIDDLRAAAQAPAKAANDHMEALFARLEKKLDEIAPRRAEPIDLPALPTLRSRVN